MKILDAVKKNLPSILTAGGVVGIFATGLLTRRAAIKEVEEREFYEYKKQFDDDLKFRPYKLYILPAASALATAGCFIFADRLHVSRETNLLNALAWAYSYKDKVKDVIGEDQEEAIFREFQKDKAIEKIYESNKILGDCSDGMEWYFEPISEQFFQCNEAKMDKAVLVINKKLANHWEVRFNEFLEVLGCKPANSLGNAIGWYATDSEGFWDWNWSFLSPGSPWIDVKAEEVETKSGKVKVLSYNLYPDYTPDEIEEPEDF